MHKISIFRDIFYEWGEKKRIGKIFTMVKSLGTEIWLRDQTYLKRTDWKNDYDSILPWIWVLRKITLHSFHQEDSISSSLNMSCPFNLIWLIEYGGNDVPILSLGLKGLFVISILPFESSNRHVPWLAYWMLKEK